MSNKIFMFMNESLKKIVAKYTMPTENGVEVDIKALFADDDFRQQVIAKIIKNIKPEECVVIPAFDSRSRDLHLGQLINELALTLQVKTLVTGNVENFMRLKIRPKKVVIIKQSFREGKQLQEQIATLRKMNCNVRVLCLMAHSKSKAKAFAKEHRVRVTVLTELDA